MNLSLLFQREPQGWTSDGMKESFQKGRWFSNHSKVVHWRTLPQSDASGHLPSQSFYIISVVIRGELINRVYLDFHHPVTAKRIDPRTGHPTGIMGPHPFLRHTVCCRISTIVCGVYWHLHSRQCTSDSKIVLSHRGQAKYRLQRSSRLFQATPGGLSCDAFFRDDPFYLWVCE